MINRRHFSIATTAALLATSAKVGAQDNSIVLGQSAAFTGPAAQLGIQFYQGAKLYFDHINTQGGVLGRMIQIRTMDDGYEPDRCADNTRKLIEQDVFALFGYIGTPTSVVALPLATKAHIPFVAPFTGAMALRDPFNPYAYHLRASYNDETALIVKQLNNLGLNKIAVFYQNDAYGMAGLSGMQLALQAHQLKPIALATVERNSVDVTAAVKALAHCGANAIVQISAYKSCAAFIRAARKAGFGGSFFNVSFVGTQALADELGRDADGVMVTQVVPSPYSPAQQISRDFMQALKNGPKEYQANFSSMEGYLAARMFAEGLRRGGKLSREGLMAGLDSLASTSLGGFVVNMSPHNHVASNFVDLSMITGDGHIRT